MLESKGRKKERSSKNVYFEENEKQAAALVLVGLRTV